MDEWITSKAEIKTDSKGGKFWLLGDVKITCPGCGGSAIVNKKRWLRSRPEFVGRSCTYCFKTYRIPGLKPAGTKKNDKYRVRA
jgi:hypothetical protein